MLRTVVLLVVSSLYMIWEGGIFIPLGLLRKDSDMVYRAGLRVAKLVTWLSGAKITVENPENLRPGRPAVYVLNHVSNIDPTAVATILPRVVIMAKHQAFKIPIAATAFRLVGFIPVYRGTDRAAQSVTAGTNRLKEGFSMLAYPEGTRTRSGELLPFRHGVFLMAIRANAVIVPITSIGFREMMPVGQFAIKPGPIRFVVHAPIFTDGMKEEDRGALAERTRDVIASALPPGDGPSSLGVR
jgi:1-acyl-sn-glycerol-3-phosphate acyltransferase